MKREIIVSTVITIISLGIAFTAGFLTNQFINPPELNLPILAQAQNIIQNHAYYELPPDPAMEYGMIHGLVGAIQDPYSAFVEPVQHELTQDTFEGEFGGIGAEVRLEEDQRITLFPFPDSPAEQAGVENGDILTVVDGTEITLEMDIHTVVSMVRGPEGERVQITIQRPPEMTEYEFVIKRQVFQLPSVTWRIIEEHPEIGLVDINLIASSTTQEIRTAIEELRSKQADKFIIDLTGNGGGILDSGIEIAQLFLHDGDVILYQHFKGEEQDVYKANSDGEFSSLPMVVLIDQNSASASEIIAGAIQAHQRAPLLGRPSYGKNTIQLVFTLDDNSSVHVTSAVWWLEGGNPDEAFKLIPDFQSAIENPTQEDLLDLAVEYFQNN